MRGPKLFAHGKSKGPVTSLIDTSVARRLEPKALRSSASLSLPAEPSAHIATSNCSGPAALHENIVVLRVEKAIISNALRRDNGFSWARWKVRLQRDLGLFQNHL